MINIHIYNTPETLVYDALSCAKHFIKEYPERMGIRDGVGYRNGLYVYRTKSGRVVVRTE